MTNIKAKTSSPIKGLELKKGTKVSIINIEGMRCTICTDKGLLGICRFDELEITDTSVLK